MRFAAGCPPWESGIEMRLYYDLHIHSALSPCANEDMTPNNIINMSRLKGLDVLSVCDHNCAANLKAVDAAARKAGLLFLPGIEMNTAEEVHLLAYFEDIEAACRLGGLVYDMLPDIQNNDALFGPQLIVDEEDNITGKLEKLLISALPFSIEKCVRMIVEHGGYAVPAHINRGANSLLGNLGFIPEDISFKALEVLPGRPAGADISGYNILTSSDAHYLEDISEKTNFILTKNKSVSSLLNTIFNQPK